MSSAEERARQTREYSQARVKRLVGFEPVEHEVVSVDLLVRTDQTGVARAFIAVSVNDETVVLSRGSWTLIMEKFNRLVWGSRIIEKGTYERAERNPPSNMEELQEMGGYATFLANLILGDNPIDMQTVEEITDQPPPAKPSRDPASMMERLRRKEDGL